MTPLRISIALVQIIGCMLGLYSVYLSYINVRPVSIASGAILAIVGVIMVVGIYLSVSLIQEKESSEERLMIYCAIQVPSIVIGSFIYRLYTISLFVLYISSDGLGFVSSFGSGFLLSAGSTASYWSIGLNVVPFLVIGLLSLLLKHRTSNQMD